MLTHSTYIGSSAARHSTAQHLSQRTTAQRQVHTALPGCLTPVHAWIAVSS